MEFELQKASSENSGVVNELQYKLGHVANYIVGRSSVLYYPSGGTVYAPRASKTLRFNLTGDNAWLDASTLNVRFQFNNTSAHAIKLLNALPANFFYRMRILAHQTIIEDWSYYNRIYNTIHALLPAEKKFNDYCLGFGFNDDVVANTYSNVNFESTNTPPQVDAGKSRVVQFNLFSGLLSQTKYIPLHYLKGLTIELELVSDVNDCITRAAAADVYDWTLTEPVVMCDIVQLDQSLENEFANALLDGESLPIAYDSFVTQLQSLPSTDQATISLSRSFTRLKSLFITFYNPIRTLEDVLVVPAGGGAAVASDFRFTATEDKQIPLNAINHFYHKNFIRPGGYDLNAFPELPALTAAFDIRKEGYYRYCPENDNLSIQVQIGAKLFPEQPIESLSSAYYHLRKTLGNIKPTSPFSLNINDKEYRSHKFICGVDLEKCNTSDFSGINAKMSDQITIRLKNLSHTKVIGTSAGQILAGSSPEYMYVSLNYSGVLLISDKGISVLE